MYTQSLNFGVIWIGNTERNHKGMRFDWVDFGFGNWGGFTDFWSMLLLGAS